MIPSSSEIKRFGEHQNAFGFLRLLFATLVIVAHTPELADGNRSREILTQVFGTISFGELAVDCFFLISGYLIAGSFLKKPVISSFLIRRIARIYPGFIVSSLICILLVAPLAGAWDDVLGRPLHSLKLMLMLRPPEITNSFADSFYPDLNGAMWTISLEFRCYLMVLLLGVTGLLRHPLAIVVLLVLCFISYELHFSIPYVLEPRTAGAFLTGTFFYLWRDQIPFILSGLMVAAIALMACLFSHRLAEPGLAVFGGYIIFYIASQGSHWPIARINNRDDISYGVYLYAWPIEKLVLWYAPGLPLLVLGGATFVGAFCAGWLSWRCIEKPALQMARR